MAAVTICSDFGPRKKKSDTVSTVSPSISHEVVGPDAIPWTARRSNQSILKEISPGCFLEGMMLKLKLQYFGHLTQRVDSLEKTDAGRDWGQEEKGTTEDEMAGWHH